MKDDTISRQAATQTALDFIVEYLGGAFDEDFQKKLTERMNALPSAQPDRDAVTMMEDGTLSITVDMDITNVGRILLSQKGTHWGTLYYPDETTMENE